MGAKFAISHLVYIRFTLCVCVMCLILLDCSLYLKTAVLDHKSLWFNQSVDTKRRHSVLDFWVHAAAATVL